jgi:raffinose/stachyose/melibiose transport system substrate-binding protein
MRLLDSIVEVKCGSDTADKLNKNGGDWGKESCVNDAYTELKKWGDNYLNSGFMAISQDDSSQIFYTGKAAMAYEGTWFNGNIKDNGPDPNDVGIFAFPGTDRLYGFGEAFYVNPATKHADAAAKFLDYVTSEQGQQLAGSAWAALSVNKAVTPSADNPLNAVWVDLFGAAKGIYTNNDQNFTSDVTNEYWRIQNAVLTGDIKPADAGAQFQQFRDANKS